jgi:hypothetical protein
LNDGDIDVLVKQRKIKKMAGGLVDFSDLYQVSWGRGGGGGGGGATLV